MESFKGKRMMGNCKNILLKKLRLLKCLSLFRMSYLSCCNRGCRLGCKQLGSCSSSSSYTVMHSMGCKPMELQPRCQAWDQVLELGPEQEQRKSRQ